MQPTEHDGLPEVGRSAQGRRRSKAALLVWLVLLAGCSGTVPARTGGCIPGDPSGPPECQALTYDLSR